MRTISVHDSKFFLPMKSSIDEAISACCCVHSPFCTQGQAHPVELHQSPGMLKSTYLPFNMKTAFQVQSAINVALF